LSTRSVWQTGPHTPERRRAIYEAFNAGRARLQKKYNVQAHPAKTAATAAAQRKVQAGFDLRDADLEDVEAAYIAKAGDPGRAQRARHHASLQRVKAQIAFGNAAEAEKQAAKLLAATPEDPDAYQTIAELYQSHRKFKEAAAAWEGGIKLLTTGTGFTPGQRTQSLGLFYRQLAFSYSKAGRTADAEAAMKRAQSVERGGN
jgi:tetratricopeptide (TPR) repeat protein